MNLIFNMDNLKLDSVWTGCDHLELLRKAAEDGLRVRIDMITERYKSRLEQELKTIESLGIVDCYLLLMEIIRYAVNRGIMIGPGNFFAGSLVFYALGVTDIDPIKYNLIFARFIRAFANIFHESCIDICAERHHELAEHVMKYEGLSLSSDISETKERGRFAFNLIWSEDQMYIQKTIDLIKKYKKLDINIAKISYDDEKTYELIASGDTRGIYDLDAYKVKKIIKTMPPNCFNEIIALIALSAYCTDDQVAQYRTNKNHPDDIVYRDSRLKSILASSHGCVVYQEQLIQILHDIAGYNFSQAEEVRRILTKKKENAIEVERHRFVYGFLGDEDRLPIKGCVNNGVSEDEATAIFNELLDCCVYLFSRGHATGCAITAYRLSWLKANFRMEYSIATRTDMTDPDDGESIT